MVALTNMYLCADEYARLLPLPSALVSKTRSVVRTDAHPYDVVLDEFHGHLRGLRLAEFEVPDPGQRISLPPWLGAEVTRDDHFSGGRLATADEQQVVALLGISSAIRRDVAGGR